MEENLLGLIERLELNEQEKAGFKNAKFLEKPVFLKQDNTLKLVIECEEPLEYATYDVFVSRLQKMTHTKINLKVNALKSFASSGNINRYVRKVCANNSNLKVYLKCYPLMENERLVYQYENQDEIDLANDYLDELKIALTPFGINNEVVVRRLEIDGEIESVAEQVHQEKAKPKQNNKKKYNIKTDKYQFFKLKNLQDGMESIKISGQIFDISEKEDRQNRFRQRISITDFEEAFIIDLCENRYFKREEMQEFHVGDYIEAFGSIEYSTFYRCLQLRPKQVNKINHQGKVDKEKEKRVELHLHTKLSEMDGVSNIGDYLELADKWGHNAMALTDHNVVQAYPAAQRISDKINENRDKDHQFKMIYGVEFNMYDPDLKPVTNPSDELITSARYCIFDLEATGLSSKYDEIIEFGGVIVEDGLIVDKKAFFIKPTVEISAHITNLTNIKNDDVKDAMPIEEAIEEILDYTKGCVLVAHNAEYDINMLNAALVKCGKEKIKTTYIDTLDLAKYLLPERKYYNLGSVARNYKIKYDTEIAHRADYDAEILSEVFTCLLKELKDVKTFNDLSKCVHTDNIASIFEKHVTVLAKNDQGITDIFEMVSLSHTKYLAEVTTEKVWSQRIPREVIKQYQDKGNILVGSSCLNGDVFDTARTRDDDKLRAVIDFYDYIELQPLENYLFLVRSGNINSLDRLKDMLKSIARIGKEAGKIVVATGDAHYASEELKLVRDIFINAKAIGGFRHPLYHRSEQERKNNPSPAQHFRTTTEMLEAFEFMGIDYAYELVVLNSNKIADLCDFVHPVKKEMYPPEIEGSKEKLTKICYDTAHSIYGETLPEIVEKRLDKELSSIIDNDYHVIYYISHLLVKQSNDDGYLVGSRGSVGSSFVATMSGITEVNPLEPHYICPKCHHSEFNQDKKYQSGFDLPNKKCPVCGEEMYGQGQNIPFETFLGFDGKKTPDIDLNFSGDYQGKAHQYLQDTFGVKNAFRAGTIGGVAEKTAYGYVKGYEEEMGQPDFFSDPMINFLASRASGVRRTTGQHPGGIVVLPSTKPVNEITPVQYPANNPHESMKTTHLDYHEIEQNVLKFDILGHVDPTAMKMLEEISGIDVRNIPLNDPATMSIFSSVDALNIDTTKCSEKTGAAGLPEFGTQFVRGILEDTHPTTFEELLKISGLSHGTDVWLNNAKDLIDKKVVELKNVIGCRDDIMVYLMGKGMDPKLAFTIMESVRKGRGLKDDWIDAMRANGVEEWYIDSCQKIKYMFPKAHATAYVIMALRIAWFKVHHPLHYYCQFFSIRCDAYDIDTMLKGEASIRAKMSEIERKLNNNETKYTVTKKEKDIFACLELALEMFLRGYRFGKIDLNKSEATRFSIDPNNENTIIPSFTSIDGLGDSVAISIVEAREKAPFLSKQDLLNRTGLSDTLVKKLGALGSLEGLQEENQMSLF